MYEMSSVLYVISTCLVIYLFLGIARKGSKGSIPKTLPPGPPPLPIIGNLLSLGAKPHISMTELAKKYGPLMTLQLGQVPTVIISSAAVAKEAFQKNDVSLSDRWVVDAVRALDHHEQSTGWLPLSPKWRTFRKVNNSLVLSAARVVQSSKSLGRIKVENLLSYVKECSEAGIAVDIGQAAFTTTLNLLHSTFFSVDLGDPGSDHAHEFKKTVRGIMEDAGKPNLSDHFPILRKVDPQGIRRRMCVHYGKLTHLINTITEQRLQGNRPPGSAQGSDVLDAMLAINQETPDDIIEPTTISHLLAELFIAGTDTTSSTLEWAMAELLHNPDKLKKAQAELREVAGMWDTLQDSDIIRLPYLQAVIKETFRLHPPAPLALPRKAASDLNLTGFTVPKDARVLINVWAIGRDPKVWKDPDSFEPERFLGLDIDIKDHNCQLIPFGVGRRSCPGSTWALRMLQLMLGSLLHDFDWKLEDGLLPENMDMDDIFGVTLEKAQRLRAIPVAF